MTALAIPQPEYRALMMFDTLPAGCISFPCKNHSSMPHIKAGEFVVVDTRDRVPVAGELFVIKFSDRPHDHHICMTRKGTGFRPEGWRVGAVVNDKMARLWALIRQRADLSDIDKNALLLQANGALGAWTEGPYGDEGSTSYQHLCNCLVGRVIGLYSPQFEELTRNTGAAK